jgi:hypothetical protein
MADLIDPALQAAGWDVPPHSMTPKETITDGKSMLLTGRAERATRGSHDKFERAMGRASDTEPAPEDRL